MIDIKNIDKNITEIRSGIKEFADTLVFQPKWDFTIPYTNPCPDLPKGPGLYLFEVGTSGHISYDEWLFWYRPKWEDEHYKRKFVPNFKKKRINFHSIQSQQLLKLPLYLGQSEKIQKRVWEHVILKLEQPTVALKLNERELLFGTRYYLSVIELNIDNTRIILPEIEAVLRKKFNPLVGRQ